MRNTFIKEICNIADHNKNIIMMTGDLGYGVLDEFASKFPQRFINAGISEQNMTAVAAGLALEGKTVFTYSIGNFSTVRCLEQIRNDVAYHNADVKIISIAAGVGYGPLGMSHHATEDISAMRSIPNMRIFSPSDPLEAKLIAEEVVNTKGPAYIRLGKGKEPLLHGNIQDICITKPIKMREGADVAIFVTGSIAYDAMQAAESLEKYGISCGVYIFPCIKPMDLKAVLDIAAKMKYIFTLEEHTIMGGFGGAVAEIVAESDVKVKVIRFGFNDEFTSVVGSQSYLKDVYGISPNKIADRIMSVIKKG